MLGPNRCSLRSLAFPGANSYIRTKFTMTYSTTSIGEAVNRLNQTYFLPAIQRPFVWNQQQVLFLFDSLMKGYPISAFMFWKVNDVTKHEIRTYKFIEDFQTDQLMNDPAQVAGRDVVLVLDGQQRMTSLLIGLRGTFSVKEKFGRKANPDAWIKHTLYLNLLKDPSVQPDEDEEADMGVTFGFKFAAVQPRNDHHQHWIKVGNILDCETVEKLESMVTKLVNNLHSRVVEFDREIAVENLRRLYQAIWVDESINFYTETNQSADRVLDIFVRANDGGSKLEKSDLLMAMINSKWSEGAAREEMFGFVEHIKTGLSVPNKMSRELLLKACMTLLDLDVKYNVANFTTENIACIERQWNLIKVAVANTFRLINSFGVNGENLTSLNAILPIAYFLFRNPEFSFRGSTDFERRNARLIQTWLLQSLLVGAFAGSSDRTISQARTTIRDSLNHDRNFPTEKLFDALGRNGRLARLDERGIEEVLRLGYKSSKCFFALSLLYDNLDWGGTQYHVDHIIPQSHAERRSLMAMNMPEHRIKEIMGCVNQIGNLQLLPANENLEKSDLPFDAWIQTRDSLYRDRHFIPDRVDHWHITKLPEFIASREKLLWKAMQRLQLPVAA